MSRTRQLLDRAAARAARALLAWSASRVDPWDRVWIDAMRGELDEIGAGWAQLAWAVGALRLVWIARRRAARREHRTWPEAARIVAGGMPLAVLALIAVATNVPNLEQTPAVLVFSFLAFYFAGAGFLSGRRTGHIGMGAWAGAACGLTLTAVVCVAIFTTAAHLGVRDVTRSGFLGLVGVAWSALGFFALMGAACGALGALAGKGRRQPR
jgi:hypothetical protein